jgi:hypothetical protein
MELWLPWAFPVVCILIVIGILRATFSKRFRSGWRRLLLRTSGALLSVPITFLALFTLLMAGCNSNSPLVGSPDCRHVARVQVSAALGAVVQPLASVAIRPSWHPAWKNAYVGFGSRRQDGTFEPKVKWMDNSHLLITYPGGGEDPASCRKNVGDVLVKCEVEEISK